MNMNWKEFVTRWSNQEYQSSSLELSEKLTTEELESLLRVSPDFLEENTYEDAGKGYGSRSTVRDRITQVCNKCNIYGSGSKDELLKQLRIKFHELSMAITSESLGSNTNDFIEIDTIKISDLEFPEGVIQLNSRFYMSCDRELKESVTTIAQSKGFVRIKSPRQMGKTSLLERILDDSRQKGLRTVKVDLRSVDEKSLENLNCFLKWFCQQLISKLKLSIRISEEWDEKNKAPNTNCSDFFENYLLDTDYPPLLLSIDNLDTIFDCPNIADEFLGLLRTWLEDQSQSWKNLRMIIVHTWHYKTKRINCSPLNIGKEIKLPSLTFLQIQTLVDLHELNWNEQNINTLTNLVGYHPYLIRLALYAVAQDNIDLSALLANVMTNEGIYSKYLERHYDYLTSDRALADLMAQVVKSDLALEVKSIEIDSSSSTKLQELGLVEYSNNTLVPKNQLFKLYFADRL
jgi:AAA-like domain